MKAKAKLKLKSAMSLFLFGMFRSIFSTPLIILFLLEGVGRGSWFSLTLINCYLDIAVCGKRSVSLKDFRKLRPKRIKISTRTIVGPTALPLGHKYSL